MKLSLRTFAIFSFFISLIVFFNPDFSSNGLIKWTCIMMSTISLGWAMCIGIRIGAYFWWRFVFAIWCVLSYLFVSSKLNTGYASMMDFLLQSLIVFLAAICIQRWGIKSVVKPFVVAALIMCCYVIANSGFENFMTTQLGGITMDNYNWNSNAVGGTAAIALVLMLMFSISKYDNLFKMKSITIFCYICFVVVVLWTGSRTALIVAVLGCCGMWVISSNNPAKLLRNIIAVIVSLTIVCILIMNNDDLYSIVGSRMERLFDFVGTGRIEEKSIDWRNQMIVYGLTLFKENALFGIGINGFSAYFGSVSSYTTYAHNNFVELLADGGIVAFICYYSIYVVGLYHYRKSESLYKKYVMVLLLVLLLSDVSSVSYISLRNQLGICIAICSLYNPEKLSDLECQEHTAKHNNLIR